MPPWVWIRPSSTVSPPGPTCFHPVRSLPSKSCCHLLGSPLQAFSFPSAARASVTTPVIIKREIINRFSIGNLLGFLALYLQLSLGQTNILAPASGIKPEPGESRPRHLAGSAQTSAESRLHPSTKIFVDTTNIFVVCFFP